MSRLFSRLRVFGISSKPADASKPLRVERLESREAPALAAMLANGTLVVNGGDNDDQIVIEQTSDGRYVVADSGMSFNAKNVRRIEVNGGGGNDLIDLGSIAPARKRPVTAKLIGGAGNDTVVGTLGNDTIFGGAGNDLLVGRTGNDFLNGQEGDDNLYADEGSDRLEGGEGNDKLFGADGVDHLNGGAGSDVLEGGAGRDAFKDVFDPQQWAVDGYTPQDVQQGSGGTCSMLATMAASAWNGEGVRGNIEYLGNNNFRVKLNDTWLFGLFHSSKYEIVNFDGSWYDHDAQPTRLRADDGSPTGALAGDFWTTIYQRAVLQAEGENWRDYRTIEAFGMSGSTAHHAILGDADTSSVDDDGALAGEMRDSLRNGAIVTAGTRSFGKDGAGAEILEQDGVISLHAYAVMDVYQGQDGWRIRLYNPWGWDSSTNATDGRDDGVIDISWKVFVDRFEVWTETRL